MRMAARCFLIPSWPYLRQLKSCNFDDVSLKTNYTTSQNAPSNGNTNVMLRHIIVVLLYVLYHDSDIYSMSLHSLSLCLPCRKSILSCSCSIIGLVLIITSRGFYTDQHAALHCAPPLPPVPDSHFHWWVSYGNHTRGFSHYGTVPEPSQTML